MAFSTDSDLVELQPDILSLGLASFADAHDKAQTDILRYLKANWWPSKGISGDIDVTLLTASQFNLASCYLVLWKFALPQLTNWVEEDRFQMMIEFYKTRYGEEMAAILGEGVEYDADNDGIISDSESSVVGAGYLVR